MQSIMAGEVRGTLATADDMQSISYAQACDVTTSSSDFLMLPGKEMLRPCWPADSLLQLIGQRTMYNLVVPVDTS